jgi:hypothetical protein
MILGSRERPERDAGITAIAEPIFWTMCDLEHLTTIQASTECYGECFFLLLYF